MTCLLFNYFKELSQKQPSTDFSYLPQSEPVNANFPNVESLAMQLAGKLVLREELPLEANQLNALLEKNLIETIPSITTKPLQCRRCGNQALSLFGKIPCARCNKTHFYCRNCIQMGRVMECTPLYCWTGPPPEFPIPKQICAWDGKLTPAQAQAAQRITEAMEQSNTELLCWAVCGAGKTEMLFQGITKALAQGKHICLATPRADVVRELLPRLQKAFPQTTITGLYGGSEDKQTPAPFVIATTHQLLRYARAFDVIIIDEIDAFPYHADPKLPFVTTRAAKLQATFIYLTATPRKDLQRRIKNKSLPTVFVPLRFHGHPLPEPQLVLSFTLHKALARNQLPQGFWSWYQKRTHPDRQLLLFIPTIAQTTQLLPSLKKQLPNHTIEAVHANDNDREAKIQHFRAKQITLLLTTTILERGVTFPSVDVAIIDAGHAVFDQAALIQMAGRAGRSPDDPTGEVIFLHDGKTEAMLEAKRMIQQMNQRGRTID